MSVILERKLRCVRSSDHEWFIPGRVYTSKASNIGGVDMDARFIGGENHKSVINYDGEMSHRSCGREFTFEQAYNQEG